MIYLILSVTASICIFVVFKLLKKLKVNTFQTIVINYGIAFGFGILSVQKPITIHSILNSDWFLGSIIVGALFIGLFTMMAWTAQKNGLSVASVASKMSVIIPIIFGVILFHESIAYQKIIGIVLAFMAVYLVSAKSKTTINFKKNLMLPLALFLGSGLSDTYINYLQQTSISDEDIPLFSACVFGFAGIIGMLIISVKRMHNQLQWDPRSIPGGVILGLANYASLYYIIKALQSPNMESSTFFTLNNVAIVMISTLIGLWFFKEHLTKRNWTGIGLALIAIYLVTFA
ncbi:GRP family sugar transporter [Gelidibacter maritimus]|uniref:DMT family transporter n=1 Tax=Gelidibacter maritimus TaxID=2761487 RepID=A0A7W2R1V4_9FLAO|nr:GRP family sugar transporter [Gelidibacter maritimus]MBA6151124.1 DMT family transporter [Gelidibacter maritimus]